MKTKSVTYRVQVPEPPNFLRLENGSSVPIEAITEVGLREIGTEWTESLMKKAKEKRKVKGL